MGRRLPVYVLAGGGSQRFGEEDKARVLLGGETLLNRVAGMMSEVADGVICVGREAGDYDDLDIETIGDQVKDCGPLGGLAAGLKHQLETKGRGWCFFCSCDLGLVKSAWLDLLFHGIDQGGCVGVVFKDKYWEPFPGLYHTDLLESVDKCFERKRYAMQGLLCGAQVKGIGKPADWLKFNQLNRMVDVERFIEMYPDYV